MNSEPAVVIRGLRKRFGHLEAVAGIDLCIPHHQVFGLLGPNGAGKTTTLKMLCGLLKPDGGTIRVLGRDLHRRWAAAHIGLCPQDLVIWEELTLGEQLRYVAAIQDVPRDVAKQRAAVVLRDLGLEDKARRLASTLSGGMKRRLNLALALMHDPAILVLDEPQAGLDPQSRLLVREFVRGMAGTRTVIVTTHDMEEADKLSSRVAILDHGRILAEDSPDALKSRHAGGGLLEFRVDAAVLPLPDGILDGPEWTAAVAGSLVRITVEDPIACLGVVRERLAACGAAPEDVRIRRTSLEDVFISLTGRGLRE
jgi:ABC-2 type transport system ATP-binding protein